ncbi:MAG: glycine--tRNA ligase, partial [Phycisphaeraceae bacterium]|nr:glycine--tRNA ligase [Phycisphaeraceae bacterium]
KTKMGANDASALETYLRPETCQAIFVNFKEIYGSARMKVPFGIAQIGKAFRNEINPRNFIFRSREFEQMEIEFFIHPDDANDWYAYWRELRYQWWQKVGLAGDNLILREHDRDELAHYAKTGAGVCDIEYRFPFTSPGYGELEGVAHRSNFDLTAHANACGKGDKMRYFDQERKEHYFPHVIEPSAGADRGTLALLCEAYTPTPDRKGASAIMKFTPRMAPIKAGIFPLVNKEGMPEIAQKLYMQLREKHVVQLDVKQNIGKRYARMDEAGTPYCITIDGDTAGNQSVTIRDRDTLEQTRIALDQVGKFLDDKINA